MGSYSDAERRAMLTEDAITKLRGAIEFLSAAGLDDAVFYAGCALVLAEEAVMHLTPRNPVTTLVNATPVVPEDVGDENGGESDG